MQLISSVVQNGALYVRECLHGIAHGGELVHLKEEEDAVRTGGEFQSTGLLQFVTIATTANLFGDLLSRAFKISLPNDSYLALGLTSIVAIATIKWTDKENPSLVRKVSLLVVKHVGTVCQVATLALGVANYIHGRHIYGAILTAFVIYGFAARQRVWWIPHKIREGIRSVCRPITITFYMTSSSNLEKFAGIENLLGLMSEWLSRWQEKNASAFQPTTNDIAPYKGTAIVESELQVDRTHVCYVEELRKYDGPIDNLDWLQKLFDEVDWSQDPWHPLLLEKLKEDEDNNELDVIKRPHPGNEVTYAQEGMRLFIEGIKNKSIKNGEIKDYTDIINQALLIAHAFNKRREGGEKISSLAPLVLQLALAAYYCPVGYVRALEQTLAYARTSEMAPDNLHRVVLGILTKRRLRLLEQFIMRKQSVWSSSVFGMQDMHKRSLNIRFFGPNIGVNDISAKIDRVNLLTAIGPWLFGPFTRHMLRLDYWPIHDNPKEIIDELQTTLINHEHTSPILVRRWLKEQGIEESEAWDTDVVPAKFRRETVILMAIQMGLFLPPKL